MAVTRTTSTSSEKPLVVGPISPSSGSPTHPTRPEGRRAPHFDVSASSSIVAAPSAPEVGSPAIEMGLGYIVQNNEVLQSIAASMARSRPKKPAPAGPLNFQPAWEVDYFRWPKLARNLFRLHFRVFDRIGTYLLSQTQVTQRRIAICSTFPREGKSTIAICLALWAARNHLRTVLVDGDVEKPGLTRYSGLDAHVSGWQDLLRPDKFVSEVLVRSVDDGLVFLPSAIGGKPALENKVLDTLSVIAFQLKYEFETVFLDLGTIDDLCAHKTDKADLADYVVVVRDPAKTSIGQVMDTRKVLWNLGLKNTVVAENLART